LKKIPQEATGDFYVQMGFCCLNNNLQMQAEECFQTAIQVDENNVEARMELAKMYETLNEQEQAFIYINEVMSIQRTQEAKPVKRRKYTRRRARVDAPLLIQPEASDPGSDDEDFAPVKHYNYKRHRLVDPKGRVEEETTRTEQLQGCYSTLRSKREEMRNGDPEAARAWIKAARELTNDFRSVRSFYPYDKYMRFIGYKEGEARAGAEVPLDKELFDMADRLSKCSSFSISRRKFPN
jgi:general transcription factor 3C polypeptide 3 (transcription factor C subunit 4)